MIPPRPVSRRAVLGAAAALPAAGALAACTGRDDGQPEPAQAATVVPVVTTTNFLTFGRDAYLYVAQERGFFAEAGLDVRIEVGQGTIPNLQMLVAGDADFVPIDLAGLILATYGYETESRITDVKAFAAIHQQPLATVMTGDPAITDPVDLAGKRVGLPTGAVTTQLFPVWARLKGIDLDLIRQELMQGNELIPALVSGDVDAIGQFAPGRGTVEAALGRAVTVFPYSDVLGDMLGVVYVTKADLIESQPDLVARFRDAVLRGLDYALLNPDESGQILQEYVPDAVSDPAVPAAELRIMDGYSRAGADALGHIDESRVMRSIGLLESTNAIPAGLVPDDIVDFSLTP